MTFKIDKSNGNDTKRKTVIYRHHAFHPLLGKWTLHRRNTSSSDNKQYTEIRHNISGSNHWQFKSKSLPLAFGQSSNATIFIVRPSIQGSEKTNFLSRTSVLSGTETNVGENVQRSFKLPASIAVITIAATFFTLALISTVSFGAVALCRRGKKLKIRLCSPSSFSSFGSPSPTSGLSECKDGAVRGGEELMQEKDTYADDVQTLLDSSETCPLHIRPISVLSEIQDHFYWFQEGDECQDEESYQRDLSCYGSYPFLASPMITRSSWLPSTEDVYHYCKSSGFPPDIKLTEILDKLENNETQTCVRAVEHSCSLDELMEMPKKKSLKLRLYDRLREKLHSTAMKHSGSTVSYSEIPSRTDECSSDESKMISREIIGCSFDTISTSVSHPSVTKSEIERCSAPQNLHESETESRATIQIE